MSIWRREMGKQDSSWRRVFSVLVCVFVLCDSVSGKQMSETLQRALSAVRGPSPGAKKLLNIPEDGDNEEEPQISLADSVQLTESHNHNTIDTYGKETYHLLEQVCLEIKYEKEEKVEKDKEEQYLEQAQRYTGLHKDVLYNLWKYSLTIYNIKEINRKFIHDELMRYNLEDNIMPTATDLFNSLQHCIPPYVDIRTFQKKLVKMGYIFKKTDLNTAVVIENPAVRFERYMYLKNLTRYREGNKLVYFICQGALTVDRVLNIEECEQQQLEDWQHRFICAVSSKDVKGFRHVPKGSNFEKWILETLVEIDEGSVIVLDNTKQFSEKLCETPNPNSLKCDMIEWLEYHHVPHIIDTMSRLELWMLIEKYTDTNANLYKTDNLVKQSGFKVLRSPDCLSNLTPAPFILDIIQKNLKRDFTNVKIVVKRFEDIIKAISEAELSVMDSSLIVEEKRLLELDSKLDNVMDYLIPSNNPEIDTCLPSLSDLE